MDLPWKVLNPASSSAILIVLIFASLNKGLLSQNTDYKITVPDLVSVQLGLCVHIPCNFTYLASDRTHPQKLYGYWYRNTRSLVATNDDRRYTEHRHFKLTGEPEEGNCSFSILEAMSQDDGTYYFRIEDIGLGYNYISKRLRIRVTAFAEKPQIRNSSAVLLGKEAVFTCLVLGPCNEYQPTFYWTHSLTGWKTSQWSHQQSNGSWIYGSNATFVPTPNDQGKSLTCKVWLSSNIGSIFNSISLDIADPPKTVEITTNASNNKYLDSCLSEVEGDMDSAVAREGETVRLVCKAESRPDPTLTWRKGNKTLSGSKQGKKYILLLSDVRPEDTGQYQCHAETPYGSSSKILQLCVMYHPRQSDQSRSTCWQKDNNRHCNCSLLSWPKPQIRWEADGQNFSEGDPQVISMYQENEFISMLNWTTRNPGESHSIICLASNDFGAYTLHFLLIPSTKWSHASLAISGLCGALVAVILCVFCLCLIKFYKQRKAKASSKAGGMEVLNSANGGHQRANDGSLIYSNISPVGQESPCVDQSNAGREKMSTPNPWVPSSITADPEELYYATLDFSKLKTKEPTAPEESVEYSDVK